MAPEGGTTKSPPPKKEKRAILCEKGAYCELASSLSPHPLKVGVPTALQAPGRESRGSCALIIAPRCPCGSGETPKLVGFLLRHVQSLVAGDLPLQKTIFCLATLRSRLLMHGSAVRGRQLIATSRRGARDLSCSHGGGSAARKVRASASEVKGGGGYDHPLTHGPVFQRDKRIIESLIPGFGDSAPRKCRPEAAAPETRYQPLPFSN